MMRNIAFLLLVFVSTFTNVYSQNRKEFIHKYKYIAISEMQRTGIPASISLAQAILESSCGRSYLARKANNYFGIKCHDWRGRTIYQDDDEEDECFRKYKHVEDSWKDHSEFLCTHDRYRGLFRLDIQDYKGWARGLKAAGYATASDYSLRLIKIIEDEKLYKFDSQKQLSKRDFKHSTNPYYNREEIINGVPCLEIKEGDSLKAIALAYNIKISKLLYYNEKSSLNLNVGDIIFLKKKKRRAARGYDFHRIKPGDSLYSISQNYGVRLKKIILYNNIGPNTVMTLGNKIYLRHKAK